MEQIIIKRDQLHMTGELYSPKGIEQYSLVILCHGFGGNMDLNRDYAMTLVNNGYGAFIFDFIGGGIDIKSEGSMLNMSVLTEAEDLMKVIETMKQRSDIDQDSIYLMGASQGGFVASYVAGRLPDLIKGLILLYPAFVLQHDARRRTPDYNQIEDTYDVFGITVGSIYIQDALSFDIYDEIGRYTRDVLIIHGTKDRIVPISYSERAIKVYDHAKLKTIKDAGHGFHGKEKIECMEYILDYLRQTI